MQHGKHDWVAPREDKVEAKGAWNVMGFCTGDAEQVEKTQVKAKCKLIGL